MICTLAFAYSSGGRCGLGGVIYICNTCIRAFSLSLSEVSVKRYCTH